MSFQGQFRPDGIMVDGGGVGGGVVDNVRNRRLHCYEVQFGGKDVIYNSTYGNTGERYANNRAAIYGACRAWIKTGCLPPDPELRRQMLAIRYTYNVRDEILLERKEDLVDEDGNGVSLDDIDALCLTFSYPIAPNRASGGDYPEVDQVVTEWNPYEYERMLTCLAIYAGAWREHTKVPATRTQDSGQSRISMNPHNEQPADPFEFPTSGDSLESVSLGNG